MSLLQCCPYSLLVASLSGGVICDNVNHGLNVVKMFSSLCPLVVALEMCSGH